MRDDRLGLSWAAPAAEISLRRDVAGLAGDISLAFAASGDPASLDVAFLFDKSDGVVDLAARFSAISLAHLGPAVPDMAPVRGLTPRIRGPVPTPPRLPLPLGPPGSALQGPPAP